MKRIRLLAYMWSEECGIPTCSKWLVKYLKIFILIFVILCPVWLVVYWQFLYVINPYLLGFLVLAIDIVVAGVVMIFLRWGWKTFWYAGIIVLTPIAIILPLYVVGAVIGRIPLSVASYYFNTTLLIEERINPKYRIDIRPCYENNLYTGFTILNCNAYAFYMFLISLFLVGIPVGLTAVAVREGCHYCIKRTKEFDLEAGRIIN